MQVAAFVTFPPSQLWPNAATVVWALSTVPQTLQWLPSVFPAVSQVAATAASFTALWPSLTTVLVPSFFKVPPLPVPELSTYITQISRVLFPSFKLLPEIFTSYALAFGIVCVVAFADVV